MPKKLLDNIAIYASLQYDVLPERTAAYNSALISVTALLEQSLRIGSFARATATEYFLVQKDYPSYRNRPTLLLTNGFVQSLDTFISGPDRNEVATGGSESETVDAEDYTLDAEIGTISFWTPIPIVDVWYKAEYTYGFTDTDDIYDDVPVWLQQLTLDATIQRLIANGSLNREEAVVKELISTFDSFRAIAERAHARPYGWVVTAS